MGTLKYVGKAACMLPGTATSQVIDINDAINKACGQSAPAGQSRYGAA